MAKTLTNKQIQNMMMVELLAPHLGDHILVPRENVSEIQKRWTELKVDKQVGWDYVFEPLENQELREKLIDLFNTLEDDIQPNTTEDGESAPSEES